MRVVDRVGAVLIWGEAQHNRLGIAAREVGLPLLGCLDAYDDVSFNAHQAVLVESELGALADSPDLRDALADVRVGLALVLAGPGRVLEFLGD